jgi:uncharacterized protein (DUF488 family)
VVLEAGACLYTIGYQGYSQGAFVRALAARSVTVLCDVRRSTVSRLPLSSACASRGIRYEHLWRLGVPSDHSDGRRTGRDRALRFEDYRVRILPHQKASLELIHTWLTTGERVALMGFEHSSADCHRSCVAEELLRTFGDACIPLHL